MINKFLPNPCVVRNFVGLIGLAAAPALASAGSVVYQAKIVCGVDPAGVVARIVQGII
ncbi:hypothetical protein [Methylococcus sp. Mc7]|uniref:hypothetical protein n=1 Tax=Methylococcus sp. Mc7 TaxID=2860258 RepID=UPI001C5282DD|nr:hypothetical protein [Methylococcus sp. Mc7]QXP82825.1 hypothetical protein KW115_11445 [Methylococcus sp. Mc7]